MQHNKQRVSTFYYHLIRIYQRKKHRLVVLPMCVNLAGKVERRKRAGNGQVEIVLTI
jgi:hypothetical protein